MVKFLKKLKKKTTLFYKIFILKQFSPIDLWFWNDGDNTLRINYQLNEKSIVFDLGGYKGEWTNKIIKKYNCNVLIFEPVKSYYENIKYRFAGIEKIKVFNFGLFKISEEVNIYLCNDGSSIYNTKKSTVKEKIILKDIYEFVIENNIVFIDLMKINIEGGEYELLERIIETGLIKRINNLQIQFHHWIDKAEIKRDIIRTKLSHTHTETYCYPFVWENWQIKK